FSALGFDNCSFISGVIINSYFWINSRFYHNASRNPLSASGGRRGFAEFLCGEKKHGCEKKAEYRNEIHRVTQAFGFERFKRCRGEIYDAGGGGGRSREMIAQKSDRKRAEGTAQNIHRHKINGHRRSAKVRRRYVLDR